MAKADHTAELILRVKNLEDRALSSEMKAELVEALQFTAGIKAWAGKFGSAGNFAFHAVLKLSVLISAVAVIISYWPFGGGK